MRNRKPIVMLTMEIHNHFEQGSSAQVFNGNITGCVFAMLRGWEMARN